MCIRDRRYAFVAYFSCTLFSHLLLGCCIMIYDLKWFLDNPDISNMIFNTFAQEAERCYTSIQIITWSIETKLLQRWYMYPRNIKHLMTDPKGDSEFCFPRIIFHWDSRETKFTVSQGTSHWVICYKAQQNKSKFWKTWWDSCYIRPPSTARSYHVQQPSTFRG